MTEYHVFLLDGSGRVCNRKDIFAEGDDAAIKEAQRSEAPGTIEVWVGKRMVWSGNSDGYGQARIFG